ncbi:hypothetical protein BDQ17DRAFT_1349315 [Cyathus striatus]|nr:hypothetical protein BDQ17DRAFT_1349315 [Cyathus striatus]
MLLGSAETAASAATSLVSPVVMFSSLRLFHTLPCPDAPDCTRLSCLFSHRIDLPPQPTLDIPITLPAIRVFASSPPQSLLPVKRPGPSSLPTSEPPRKLQKVTPGPLRKPVALPSASQPTTMLKTLYDHFSVLYEAILPQNPTLASEHALRQEEEVYKKSTKFTYRPAVIQCAAALKRRTRPTSASHPSVGTDGEIATREEEAKSIQALHLTCEHLESLMIPLNDFEKWGYFANIPDGPGGDQPSLEGKITKCERCAQPFMVKRMEEADECIFHWGKPYSVKVNGSKTRIYTCCSRPVADSEGCTHGHHVFYESDPDILHSRYPFSYLKPPEEAATALDVAAMDCEMVYSTGGMRIARVSVVNGSGKIVFDELVKMDDGVHFDYITRFSGITKESHANARLSLIAIRKSLDSLLSKDTILVGHALENDLKALRIIHHRCVDTAVLFPHHIVREKLGKLIQTGDETVGHSSAEDAIATLDLVRWHVINTRKA